MGTIRILDCYRDVPQTFRNIGTIFYRFDTYNEFFTGGVKALGLGLPEYLLLAVGILAVYVISKFQVANGISLRHRISRSPALTFLCLAILIFVILIFGSYGLGYNASQFIYTQF